MDIALARKSGQELQNDYVITDSPDFDELRLFFRAAVRELFDAYLCMTCVYVIRNGSRKGRPASRNCSS